MSDRSISRRFWPVAGALLLALATPIGAQSRGADVQAASQRAVARFNAAALNLNRTTALVDSMMRLRTTPESAETVRAGSIVAKVGGNSPRPNEAVFVGGIANLAWAEMQAALGTSATSVASTAALHWRRDSVSFGRGRRHYQVMLSFTGRTGPSQWLQGDPDSLDAVRAVLHQYSDVAVNRLPPRTRQWAGGWAPTIRPTSQQWERVAELLATSPSSRARDCYSGVLAECVAVLDLSPAPNGDGWSAWYRPSDWPELVADWRPTDPADSALAHACVRKRAMASCRLAVTKFEPRKPLPGLAANTLLAVALERGGADAFARLVAARGTPAEVVHATAGADPMTVVAEWRTRAYAARPSSPTPTLAQSGAMAFWVIALGLLATRRRP